MARLPSGTNFGYHGGTDMKWCDYNCEHAAFPNEALEGACRTVAAVWCKKLQRLIPKNSPCQAIVDEKPQEPSRKNTRA